MQKVLLVGLGGCLGSMLRYGAGGLIGRLKGGWSFPLETLLVNVTGCLVVGFLAGMSEARGMFAGTTRAFLFAGLLGGYTTFSAFGYDSFHLLRDARWSWAILSILLHVLLGVGAVRLGDAIAWAVI
jgi:CrcB protein